MQETIRKPEWLKVKIPAGESVQQISKHRQDKGLATVCEEARCPNQWECWKEGTATFMLMGDTCTRACRFCSVQTAKNPPLPDPEEPRKLAETIKDLKLKYAVLTTVDRDDLDDFGAEHIIACVRKIKETLPGIIVEVLIPDFQGVEPLIEKVAHCGAEVIGHNVECTRELTSTVRDKRAGYELSLDVLKTVKKAHPEIVTKSSIMLGLGESQESVLQTMRDIKQTGAEILTIGQYLQPGKRNIAVKEYIHPDMFAYYEKEGIKMGFDYVASGPLVRSSYKAAEHYLYYKLSRSNK